MSAIPISWSAKSAFTIIEISMVLVIIGLLMGAVLVARDMIEAARIRATISQCEQFTTAVHAFEAKYGAMPGDLTQVQADQLGFVPLVRRNPVAVHGDGIIEDDGITSWPQYPDQVAGYGVEAIRWLDSEVALFWQDLSSAHMIPYSFTLANDLLAGGAPPTKLPYANYLPRAKLNGQTYWGVGGSPNGNYYYLGGFTPAWGWPYFMDAPTLTPFEAYNIDAKIDDGVPDTGSVMASNPYNPDGYLLDTYLPGNDGSQACAVPESGNTPGKYTVTNTNVACDLAIRFDQY